MAARQGTTHTQVVRRHRCDLPRFATGLEQRHRFRQTVAAFVEDLRTGSFRAGLRVKGVRRAPGVFELTWDGKGRATWEYGPEQLPGLCHVVWRRCGTHDILTGP